MYILHYHTFFLGCAHNLVGGINYYDSLFFKSQFLKQLLYFLKNPICLINRINKVRNFIHNHTLFVHCAIGFYFSQNVSYLKKEESIVGIFRNLYLIVNPKKDLGNLLKSTQWRELRLLRYFPKKNSFRWMLFRKFIEERGKTIRNMCERIAAGTWFITDF